MWCIGLFSGMYQKLVGIVVVPHMEPLCLLFKLGWACRVCLAQFGYSSAAECYLLCRRAADGGPLAKESLHLELALE